jgi:Spy/CpxP family protein refolding chaperone
MKTSLWITAAALACAATLASAQGPGYGGGMMGGYGPGMMMGGGALSDLTEAQQDKLFAIQEQHRSKNFATMSKLRGEMFQLRRMMNADNPDSKAVLEQQKKVDELRRTMLASRLEMRKEMEKVLTPEQVKQLRARRPGWWSPDDGE